MEETSAVSSLLKAVERYFALMYDCDTSNFEKVFRSTAQLHGFREGKMSMAAVPTDRKSTRLNSSH